MDSKGGGRGDVEEEGPSSPYAVLKKAGEAIHNAYSSSSSSSSSSRHRRTISEVFSNSSNSNNNNGRSNSFSKFRSQLHKAWGWGNDRSSRLRDGYRSYNYEVLANQKRQWYQLHPKTQDHTKYKEPTSLFEHFIIAGLQSDANLEAVENAFVQKKKWESEVVNSEVLDHKKLKQWPPSNPTMDPQILYKYPPGKRFGMRMKDLASFCFPGAVKAKVVERTPSLSDLNELFYGQEHLARDDLAFIFSLKAPDNASLYGVCLLVPEIVQRPPGILGSSSPLSHLSRGCSRFLVSAPRCYCLLTRVPFFELHFEMLNSIIAQERLNRITQFVNEMALSDYIPSLPKQHDPLNENADSPERDSSADWMASVIPVDSAATLAAAAAGLIPDYDVPSPITKACNPRYSESFSASEASDFSHTREIDKDGQSNTPEFDDNASEVSDSRSDLGRMSMSYDNGQDSPEANFLCRSHTMDHLGNFDTLFSPARSVGSEEEDDDPLSNSENSFGDDLIMEWAKENKNDLLQIVCGYHALSIPARGESIVFRPLEHLQAIEYKRPPNYVLGLSDKYIGSLEVNEAKAKLDAAEEAFALSIWATATLCRALSLECVLTLITGVLLEKQVVAVCPNLGVLSAIVLSLVPIIQPFQWQSLLLPVLPAKMIDFIDAPVPFIVGIQNKPSDLRIRTSNLVQVNVQKDQVKTCHLPSLPRNKELVSQLKPIHARLSCENNIAKRHPVYRCSEVQANAASQFLAVMHHYLDSLCSDLRSHTITSVQSNNDRVSLLLKDSFIDSFPSRDRPFIKHFVDTQMFTVLSDSRLSIYENGQY